MVIRKHHLTLVLVAGSLYSCKPSDGPKKARLSESVSAQSAMYFSNKDNNIYQSVISSPVIGAEEQKKLESETGKAVESQQGGSISLPSEAGVETTPASLASSTSQKPAAPSLDKPKSPVQVNPITNNQVDMSLFPKCTIARLPVTYNPTVEQTVLLTVSCDTDSSKKMTYSWYDEKMKKLGEGKTLSAKESEAGVKQYKVYASYMISPNQGYSRVEALDLTWGSSKTAALPRSITNLVKRNKDDSVVLYSRLFYRKALTCYFYAHKSLPRSNSQVPLPECTPVAKNWVLSKSGKTVVSSDTAQLDWGKNLLDMESLSNELFTDLMVTFKLKGTTKLITDGGLKSLRNPNPFTVPFASGGPCGFEGYDAGSGVMIGCPGHKTTHGYFIYFYKGDTSLSNMRILINGVEHKGKDAIVEQFDQYNFKILKPLENKTLIQIAGDDKSGNVIYSNPVLLQYAP